MKWIILLLAVLAAFTAQAQPLQPTTSEISAFSQALLQEFLQGKAETRNNLSILLPDAEPTIRKAAKGGAPFNAAIDATFRMAGSREAYHSFLQTLQLPAPSVSRLTEYAMYLFADNSKRNYLVPSLYNYGTKMFIDTARQWYHIVTITPQSSEIRKYPTAQNIEVADKVNPVLVLTGQFKDKNFITDSLPQTNFYFFLDGVLGEQTGENEIREYFECTPTGVFLQQPPVPVYAYYLQQQTATTPESPSQESLPVPQRADEAPTYPGGDDGVTLFLKRHLRYPDAAGRYGISGYVIVRFDVDTRGKVKNVKTIGVKIGYGLEDEAIRVVKQMSDWIPAKLNGNPIEAACQLRIWFDK